MNKSKRLLSILLLSILLSSIVGWYADSTNTPAALKEGVEQQWQLPLQEPLNLTTVNNQLTNLNIWGKQRQQTNTKTVAEKWQLVGIVRVNDMPKALIEVSGELSIRRVSSGEKIMPGVKLLSISEESIIVITDGEQTEIPLY